MRTFRLTAYRKDQTLICDLTLTEGDLFAQIQKAMNWPDFSFLDVELVI